MEEQLQTLSSDGQWLADTLSSGLGQSIEAMTSIKPVLERRPDSGAGESSGEPIVWRLHSLNGLEGAELWAGVAESTWQTVGRQALSAAGIDDAPAEDIQSTWLEIIAQAASFTAHAITKRLRREVSPASAREAVPPAGLAGGVVLRWMSGETAVGVHFQWNQALLDSFDSGARPGARAPVEPALSISASNPASAAVEHSRTLDLLLEVQLPVSVSFGRAQLQLKDILKLNSGSIVELNRTVSEPVEIIINNCVIARGEVVVVEGNYGVRIKHIISKEERLRTLY